MKLEWDLLEKICLKIHGVCGRLTNKGCIRSGDQKSDHQSCNAAEEHTIKQHGNFLHS